MLLWANRKVEILVTIRSNCSSHINFSLVISIEKVIERSKETYYEPLQRSSLNWHEEENDYEPFVLYTLGTIAAAYREFEFRVQFMSTKNFPNRIGFVKQSKATLGKLQKQKLQKNVRRSVRLQFSEP